MPLKRFIGIALVGLLACLVIVGCKSAQPSVAPITTPAMIEPAATAAPTVTIEKPATAAPTVTSGPVATYPPCPGKSLPPSFPLQVSAALLGVYLAENSQPAQYELVEFDLASTIRVKNPYDPAQIDLVVHYTAPDGSQFSVPAFWYGDYDVQTNNPCGQAGWKARFTPTQAGEWTAQAEIINRGVKSEPLTFPVAAAPGKGFVRVHPQNPRYFAFDDGTTFFPVGLNIGWWQTNALQDYARWMDRLSANGGNLIRVWMASWSFGIEWQFQDLGDYQAWLLDQVFQMAQARGIYIDLVLLNHGAFSVDVNPEWTNNPYNAKNGGPCANPSCFVTDPAARQLFQRRLRYIAARWGYATNLFAWEWWNEANLTHIPNDQLAAWIKEMTPVLRQYDPYRHLVTISFAGIFAPEVFKLAEIDFAQHHEYSTQDPMESFPDLSDWESTIYPGKPLLFGEFGYSAGVEDVGSVDQWGIHLHNGLWAAAFSGFASTAMYWWWDSYIEPLDLWSQYGGLANFLEGQDLAALRQVYKARLSANSARLMVLQNEHHLLAWIRNVQFDAQLLEPAYQMEVREQKTPETLWKYALPAIHDLQLTLAGLEDGSYRARWYSPETGQWLEEQTIQVQNGTATLAVPEFTTDLALKVEVK
jgi:hypothetical protein